MRTLVVGILLALFAYVAIVSAKGAYAKRSAEEAVKAKPPTVDARPLVMPSGQSSSYAASYRWCD